MSTADKLNKIIDTKSRIKTQIESKGITTTDKFADYPDMIKESQRVDIKMCIQSDYPSHYDVPDFITSICSHAFAYRQTITSITIPNTVTYMGAAVFQASYLTNCVIPNSVTTMGTYMFYGSTKLTACTLPTNETLTAIPAHTFRNCDALKTLDNIVIPSNFTVIGDYAFENCGALTTANIPSSITTINQYAFSACGALTTVNMTNVTTIGTRAFYNNAKLANVTLNEGLTTLGERAFEITAALKHITLPSTIKTLNHNCFSGSGLTNLVIPEGCTYLGDYIFNACKSLVWVDIPSTVTNIRQYTFYNCTALQYVIVRATTPPSLNKSAWRGVKTNGKIYVPQGCKAAYEATVWNNSTATYYPKNRGWTIAELDENGNIPTT